MFGNCNHCCFCCGHPCTMLGVSLSISCKNKKNKCKLYVSSGTLALVTDYVPFPTDLKARVCLDIVAGAYWFEVLFVVLKGNLLKSLYNLKMTTVKDLMKVHNNAVDKKISYF